VITLKQVHLKDLRGGDDTDLSCSLVTKGTGHGKSWDVFLEVPDSERTKWVAVLVTIWLHTATVSDNSGLFIWVVSLVISIERNCSNSIVNCPDECCSGVTDVCTEDFGTDNEDRDAG